jgi:signal transduction histidine kinase
MLRSKGRENNPIFGTLKRSAHQPTFWGILVAVMALILFLLAFLQVRWSQEVSQAERQRLQLGLRVSIYRFNRDLYSQLLSLCRAFETPPARSIQVALDDLTDHYGDWRRISRRPDLLQTLGVWDPATQRYLLFNPSLWRFEEAALPAHLESVTRSTIEFKPASLGPAASKHSAPLWYLDEKGLVFTRHIDLTGPLPGRRLRSKAAGPLLVLELSHDYLAQVMFPELVRRYFSGPSGLIYRVEIFEQAGPPSILYQSEPHLSATLFAKPDAVVSLLHALPGPARAPGLRSGEAAEAASRDQENEDSASDAEFFASGWQPVIIPFHTNEGWKIAVKHRSGSLDQAAKELEHRNLAVGFGVLLLLVASLGLILVAVRRVHRVAQLQMDFAAGVSHELRTPLAIICSAADNLATGVITSGPQVKDYGVLIRNEGGRLTSMVDQILAFVAQESGRVRYDLQPLEVEGFIEQVLAASRNLIESSGLCLEKQIQPDLPLVRADAVALAQCLQNLISNAVKYGSEGGMIRLRAERHVTSHGEAIQLTVEDRGPGIAPVDLPHIFEPFYRGQVALATQARGTGIGLSLAKSIAEAMGGSLMVHSEPGRGAAFTLRIPAMNHSEQTLAKPA